MRIHGNTLLMPDGFKNNWGSMMDYDEEEKEQQLNE